MQGQDISAMRNITNITNLTNQICSYILLVIITVGILGNVVSIVIFQKGRLCSSSYSSKYFTCLAIADIYVLLMSALWKWLSSRSDLVQVNIFSKHQVLCQLLFFNENLPVQVSTWITVAVTVERTICLLHPLRFYNIFAAKWIYVKVACIVLVFALCNIYSALSSKSSNSNCYQVVNIWYSFVMFGLLVFLLPTLINGVCNAIMLRILYKRASDSLTSGLPVWTSRARRSEAKCVTYRIVAIGILHFVSTLPKSVFYFYLTFSGGDRHLHSYVWLFHIVASTMYYMNSGVNFIFYCLTGHDFREDMKRLLCCLSRHTNTNSTEYISLSQIRRTDETNEV